MNARSKVRVFTGFLIAVAALCILCSGFCVWQLIEGIKENETWGYSSNAVMIFVLFVVGIIGMTATLRQSQNCLNTFMFSSIIILVLCVAEIVVTAIGVAKCDDGSAGEKKGKVWDFICNSSSWVLLIPMGVLAVLFVLAIIFNSLLKKALKEDDTGSSGELDNYYPA